MRFLAWVVQEATIGAGLVALVMCMNCATAAAAGLPPPPPLSQVNCSTQMNSLQACGPFVSNAIAQPGNNCCGNFTNVQNTMPICICEILASPQNVTNGNATRILQLPNLCNVVITNAFCSSSSSQSPALSPSSSSIDCSDEIEALSPCLLYVTTPGIVEAAPKNCCSALASAESAKAVCLYELLQTVVSNSSDYNQDVNLTRALDLPKDCKLPEYSTKTTPTCHQLFIINTCPKSSAMGTSSRRVSLLGAWLLYLYLYLHLSTLFPNSEFPNFLPVKSGLMG